MKIIKFNSDDELPLNNTIEIPSMIIAVKVVFNENKKFYPEVFLDECLYKLLTRTLKKQKYNL